MNFEKYIIPMKIDIILITYNQEQYIAQAVESILMQRVNDDVQVRVIIADDCSKDKTLEIIKSYEEKSSFPFVYLQTEKNLGIAQNYKRAFEATEAEYVAVLEGDDWWTDVNRLQKHIDYLSTHIDCVMTKNNYIQYSQTYKEWSVEQSNEQILTLRQELRNYVLANMSSTMFRGSLLRTMDKRVYEYGYNQWREATDWYTHIYILQYGYGYVLNELMSVYRVDTGENVSRTERNHADHINKALMCYEQTLELVGQIYYNECRQIYYDAIDCVKQDIANQRYQKWSKIIPPCIVHFLCYQYPKIWSYTKHCIWGLIPNGLYKKMRR